MNAFEKIRNEERFKNYRDIDIISTYCPHKEGISLSVPTWCKGENTIKKDCRKCWERQV